VGQKLAITRVFEEGRSEFSGNLEFSTALSRYTYYQIGGPASVIATPKNMSDLMWISERLQKLRCPFFILGWGSNILFSDEGYYGVVIRMKHLGTQMLETEPGVLELGASVGGSTLLRRASEKGWGKLAHLTGIPGSVGGMVTMNAGTHLGEMGSGVQEVETILLGDKNHAQNPAEPQRRRLQPSDFSYRHNHFLNPGELITRAWVQIEPEDPIKIKAQIDELYQRRKSTQPVEYPSCGSVFVNPREHGLHAWQVVDRLGLRGHRVGNAQISQKHSNFIVNLGGARADEVKALIQLVKTRARDELGIEMKEEVKVIE
jgi:UDP-N-acetylmuramate dehydrogenase